MDDRVGSRFYCCIQCRNLLAAHDDIVDKYFVANGKRAFLFSHGLNMHEGPMENKAMITGIHMVSDVSCKDCGCKVGWKYQKAYNEQNKYKEGKIVLAKPMIARAYDPIFY